MSILFDSTDIKGMNLPNRFVRSATWEGLAGEDGSVTAPLVDMMVALARGGVGLIVSGHAYVEKAGQASPWQLGAHDDALVPGLQEMAQAVHDAGGRIVLQLAHAGMRALPELSGLPPRAVSVFDELGVPNAIELDEGAIDALVVAFATAASRAQRAGFDGVQLHAAHGYLLSQFLSPLTNRRADAYGGEVESRALALTRVVRAVRDTVGQDFPVLVKMNGADFVEGGFETGDACLVAGMLEDAGLDAIEVSGGTASARRLGPSRVGIHRPEREAYFREQARAIKSAVKIPVISVGGHRSFELSESLVQEGDADYIALCRPLICEPGLVGRWQAGDRSRAGCLSDNRCFAPGGAGEGVHCVIARRKAADD